MSGESLLNGIHEKGLPKNHNWKVNNFPGGTSTTVLENLDNLVLNKPDCVVIHAGTNDLTNGKISYINQRI